MRRMIPNIAVKDGNLEVSSNLAIDSIEKIGVNIPKYNHIDAITDTQFETVPNKPLFFLARQVSEITEVGGTWSTPTKQYNPPEGTIVYFKNDGIYYKINGQKRYIAFGNNGALDFKNGLTEDGKKYTGYSEKGGFTPFFTEAQYQAILNLIK